MTVDVGQRKKGSYFVLRQVRNGKDETEKEKEKKKKKKKGKGKGGKGRRRARSARRDRARSAQWQTSVSDLSAGWGSGLSLPALDFPPVSSVTPLHKKMRPLFCVQYDVKVSTQSLIHVGVAVLVSPHADPRSIDLGVILGCLRQVSRDCLTVERCHGGCPGGPTAVLESRDLDC